MLSDWKLDNCSLCDHESTTTPTDIIRACSSRRRTTKNQKKRCQKRWRQVHLWFLWLNGREPMANPNNYWTCLKYSGMHRESKVRKSANIFSNLCVFLTLERWFCFYFYFNCIWLIIGWQSFWPPCSLIWLLFWSLASGLVLFCYVIAFFGSLRSFSCELT